MQIDLLKVIKKELKPYFNIRSAIFAVALMIISSLGVIILALFTAEAVEHTSGADFCLSCHSMKPMGKSWKASVHGGNNKTGFTTKCADCHLPHNNIIEYLVVKTQKGHHDMYVELFGNPSEIDWKLKRKQREKYVYDSACLKCHKKLQDVTMANPKAFIAHKNYFLGVSNKKCVSCHKYVGHKNLGLYLNP